MTSERRGAAPLLGALLLTGLLTAAAGAVTVSGTVRDQNGAAVGGALVVVSSDTDPAHRFSTATRDDGSYRLDLSQVPTLAALEGAAAPESFGLFPNYPNPFNPSTTIPFQLPVTAPVSLDVFNSLGQPVRSLVDGRLPAGVHTVSWDATDDAGRGVAAGVYFYRLRALGFVRSGRMVLVDGHSAPAGTGGLRVPAWNTEAVGKALALPARYTILVSAPGILDYTRTGVALAGDAVLDILVNSDTDMGMLRLGLTDAPVDGADAVRLTVSAVDIQRGGGRGWQRFSGQRTFDLLSLQGVSEMLGEQVLEPGPVSGLRLLIAGAEIDIDGGTYPLEVPSGAQTGLKLNGDFELRAGQTLDLTLDFDARRSIVQRGRGHSYALKPVVRLMATETTGAIRGRLVLDDTFLPEPPTDDVITLASEPQLADVGPGEPVALVLDARALADVGQLGVYVETEPAGAFDLAASRIEVAAPGFTSPGVQLVGDTEVRLGAALLQGDPVPVDGALATITLTTAADFDTGTPARVRVTYVSAGPSAEDHQVFEGDDLHIAVGLNGADVGVPPVSVPDFGDLELTVVALQGGAEVTSARVDVDEGEYRLAFLPAGIYDVRVVTGEGLVVTPPVAAGVDVTAGQTTRGVDFSLSVSGVPGDGE